MVDVSEATMATVVPAGVKGPVNRALIRYCEWLAEKLQISYPKVWGLLSEYTHSKGMEVAGTFQLGVGHLVPVNEVQSLTMLSSQSMDAHVSATLRLKPLQISWGRRLVLFGMLLSTVISSSSKSRVKTSLDATLQR